MSIQIKSARLKVTKGWQCFIQLTNRHDNWKYAVLELLLWVKIIKCYNHQNYYFVHNALWSWIIIYCDDSRNPADKYHSLMCSLAVMLRPGLIFCYAIGVLSLFNKDCGSFLMMKITITDCRNKRSQSRTSTNKCRESCPIVNTRQVSLLIIHCLLTKTRTTLQCDHEKKTIVKLGVQELLSLGLLSSSTKDKLSRSPLDPWSLKL